MATTSSSAVLTSTRPADARATSARPLQHGRPLYRALLAEGGRERGQLDELTLSASRAFLHRQLDEAALLPDELPADVRHLRSALERASIDAGAQYRSYLDGRRAGQGRRYFSCRSHALHFLRAVAPTKLVDGAWLYGVLRQWRDPRFHGLIRTYLEELGDGERRQNHVCLYRDLLRSQDCDPGDALADGHFVQGAIQLSLGHHAAEFLPEVIGFNLGYEQLPLHLLITAYELNELDIDPYYFTLHVTVDNAASGHARKAIDAVLAAWPHASERRSDDFYRRVGNGFKLSSLGLDTTGAIQRFDLEAELLAMLETKAVFGAQLHSDYCRVGGRSVSQWLAEPGQLRGFLGAMEAAGWIRRGQPVAQSRFWRLFDDDQAPMFGVFTAYEQQLVRDWIEQPSNGEASSAAASRLPIANRFRRRSPELPDAPAGLGADDSEIGADDSEIGTDIDGLDAPCDGSADAEQAMNRLIGHLSPANHHLPTGLRATRAFARRFAGHA